MKDDYEVGYKKPPKEHQFKKGKSGNPTGRPRKKVDPDAPPETAAAVLRRADQRKIEINGCEFTPFELEVRALQVKAAKGDVPASRQLSKLRKEMGLLRPETTQRYGVLVAPAAMDEADFERLVFKQQAPFRKKRRDEEGDE